MHQNYNYIYLDAIALAIERYTPMHIYIVYVRTYEQTYVNKNSVKEVDKCADEPSINKKIKYFDSQ